MPENETYMANMANDFPTPRRFESTDEQVRRNNLARYLELSKMRSRGKHPRPLTNAKMIAGILAAFALACCLVQLGTGSLDVAPFQLGGSPMASILSSEQKAQNASTPSSAWTKGTTPYLYQTDSAWSEERYADGSISTHGCGPTCLSMAYVALTGKKDMDPVKVAQFSERNGYVDSGVTSWLLMSEGARRLGLSSRELPLDPQTVEQHLRAGNKIICSVGPGDFTTEGHFILLAGVDDQGKLIVRDPNSPERSHQAWDVDRVLSQCRNLWSLSA